MRNFLSHARGKFASQVWSNNSWKCMGRDIRVWESPARLPAWLTNITKRIVLAENTPPPPPSHPPGSASAPSEPQHTKPPSQGKPAEPPDVPRKLLRAQVSCPSSDLASAGAPDLGSPFSSPEKGGSGATSVPSPATSSQKPSNMFWDRRFNRGALVNDKGATILCHEMEDRFVIPGLTLHPAWRFGKNAQ